MESRTDSLASELMPWHVDAWTERPVPLPPALMVQGREGEGAAGFLYRLAQSVLCSRPAADGQPCDACRTCRQFRQGLHPDMRLLQPESGQRVITVDAVRQLSAWAVESPHYGGARVVAIVTAEQLNPAAANALLKLLEEPPPALHFLLLTSRLKHVMPTLRSRCQRQILPPPEAAAALQWLQTRCPAQPRDALVQALALCHDAPLDALRWLEAGGWACWQQWREGMNALQAGRMMPEAVVAQWLKWPQPGWALDFFYAWTVRRLRQRPDPSLFQLQQTILRAQAALTQHANVQLTLEAVLLTYLDGVGRHVG